jgi:hypothetical protein
VTSFEYRLHPVGPVLGGLVLHPINQATEVLRFYREFTAAQPDELQTWAGILTLPDGNLVVALVPCYIGSLEEGERPPAPLRRFGTPLADTIASLPYVAMQQLFDAAFPPGRLNYWKSALADHLADKGIAATVDYVQKVPSPHTAILFAELHGAYSCRVGKTQTAYFHRDLQYVPISPRLARRRSAHFIAVAARRGDWRELVWLLSHEIQHRVLRNIRVGNAQQDVDLQKSLWPRSDHLPATRIQLRGFRIAGGGEWIGKRNSAWCGALTRSRAGGHWRPWCRVHRGNNIG